ncbi:ATP-binding protein [Pseudomonas sp. Irchel 3E19]|uniref:ATP-binding protein n=1 Tax=Pseudomonas sp. Irchel 3E19 TaxID=2008981 RepID=UPI000BA4B092|nr:ATP-binding protein [Pseudomonas sp. Irchel 3E19]
MNSENFKIVSVSSNALIIEIVDPSKFSGEFSIGSYVGVPCREYAGQHVVGVIDNYKVKDNYVTDANSPAKSPSFLLDVKLIGMLHETDEGMIFKRGGHGIPLPPNNSIRILEAKELDDIYSTDLTLKDKLIFSSLVNSHNTRVPINGNKFFNKHFAIVGSTGSGKSHTVAKLLQSAADSKHGNFEGLNNSHIVIFDIHGEYKSAFPNCNYLNSEKLKIPYWLFDGEELSELFIESSENNSYNQVSQFRYAVIENKKLHNEGKKVFFDSPLKFDIHEVMRYIKNMNSELINKKKGRKPEDKNNKSFESRIPEYFQNEYEFDKLSADFVNGPYTGDFERFIMRLENTISNSRLDFLFKNVDELTIEGVLEQFLGYQKNSEANVTVIDLSGIPFEVLSITVSLISRILFEFGYYYKRLLSQQSDCETPILLVYEEAHKYVPRSDLTRYRASKNAIERIAKEGRKYGVTLAIVSQRPSEVSETIFSQCSNFVAMRLTNPDDQSYVRKLLPDTSGDLISNLPTLQSGEALIIGDSIIIPSMVKIDKCIATPNSVDIAFFSKWSENWKDVEFESVTGLWKPSDILELDI